MKKARIEFLKPKNISVRNFIFIIFIIIVFLTFIVSAILVTNGWNAFSSDVIIEMVDNYNKKINTSIGYFSEIPVNILNSNKLLFENNIVDLNDEIEREKYFVSILQSIDESIYSYSFGGVNGDYYGARRNASGDIEIMRNNAATNNHSYYYAVNEDLTAGELVVDAGYFDPRVRNWYMTATSGEDKIYSPIYKHFVMDDLTVSASVPIYDSAGELLGVLGTHIVLNNVNNMLTTIIEDDTVAAIIIEKDTRELIANNIGEDNYTVNDATTVRLTINDISNQSFTKAYERYIANKYDNVFLLEETNYFYGVSIYNQYGLEWYVITSIPKNVFARILFNNIVSTSLVAFAILLISIILYYLITNRLLQPVDDILITADELARGNLNSRIKVKRNDEFGKIAISINKMADVLYILFNKQEEVVKERTQELEIANTDLERNKNQLRLILDSTAEGIYGVDLDNKCTFTNTSCINILGYTSEDELIGKNMHNLIHHSRIDGTPLSIDDCNITKAIRMGEGVECSDEVFYRKDGSYFYVKYRSYPQFCNGEVVGAVITFIDYTQEKESQDKITYLSTHDSLTGLINRQCFEDTLTKINIKKNLPLSVIVADINGLKLTNDIFGHGAGDELIKTTTKVLKEALKDNHIISRVGGDEFIILLPNTPYEEAKSYIDNIRLKLSLEKIEAIRCSISMGLSTKVKVNENIKLIIENAENEMYKYKTMNRKSTNNDMIDAIISTLHEKCPREKTHSEAVSNLCVKLGKYINLPEPDLLKLKQLGYLHDIGKIVLDPEILNTDKAQLNSLERNKMREHAVVGYRILNLFDDTLDLADSVYAHHEKWDGTGYPKALKAEEIPYLARIIAVAEAYDSFTNTKAQAQNKTQALKSIKNMSNVTLDPTLTEAFIDMMQNED